LDFEGVEEIIARKIESRQACMRKIQSLNLKVRTASKEIKTIEKKKENGALSQQVCQQIEQMLQEVYQTIRAAYHGGDFEGNHCRKFLRRANEVMDSIQEIFLAIPSSTRDADDDEIRRYCRGYKRLFQYMDLLVYFTQQSLGTLTDANMVKVRSLVNMLDRLWRRLFKNVPPKTHAWGHLAFVA